MSLVQAVIEYLETQPAGATIHEIRAALGRPRIENGLHTASKSRHVVSIKGRWYRTDVPRIKKLTTEERGVGDYDTITCAEKRFAALIGSARYDDVRIITKRGST